MSRFHCVLRISQGHRYFTDTEAPGQLAVADDSGNTPATTDDGVLYVDPTRALHVGSLGVGGRAVVSVPLRKPGAEYGTQWTAEPLRSLKDLRACLRQYHPEMKLVVAEPEQVLIDAVAGATPELVELRRVVQRLAKALDVAQDQLDRQQPWSATDPLIAARREVREALLQAREAGLL